MEANATTPTSDRDLTPGTHPSAPVPNRRRLEPPLGHTSVHLDSRNSREAWHAKQGTAGNTCHGLEGTAS